MEPKLYADQQSSSKTRNNTVETQIDGTNESKKNEGRIEDESKRS